MNHTPSAGLIARPVNQQSSALSLSYGCPPTQYRNDKDYVITVNFSGYPKAVKIRVKWIVAQRSCSPWHTSLTRIRRKRILTAITEQAIQLQKTTCSFSHTVRGTGTSLTSAFMALAKSEVLDRVIFSVQSSRIAILSCCVRLIARSRSSSVCNTRNVHI